MLLHKLSVLFSLYFFFFLRFLTLVSQRKRGSIAGAKDKRKTELYSEVVRRAAFKSLCGADVTKLWIGGSAAVTFGLDKAPDQGRRLLRCNINQAAAASSSFVTKSYSTNKGQYVYIVAEARDISGTVSYADPVLLTFNAWQQYNWQRALNVVLVYQIRASTSTDILMINKHRLLQKIYSTLAITIIPG